MRISSSDRRARTSRAHRHGLALALGLIAGAAAGCGASTEAPPSARFGASTVDLRPALDFAFDSLDARPVSSEATRGKTTVLAFVTTGSLPAQAQIDFLVAMAAHDAGEVNYAAVVLEGPEGRELVELYRKSLRVPFPVAMADAATLQGLGPFGDVTDVPVTIVLDRAGRVAWRSAGRVAKSAELRGAMRGL